MTRSQQASQDGIEYCDHPTFWFGCHKGKLLEDVPTAYLRWAYGTIRFDQGPEWARMTWATLKAAIGTELSLRPPAPPKQTPPAPGLPPYMRLVR